MTTHTKGPWDYENGEIIQRSGGYFGYQIAIVDHEYSDFPQEVIEANGRLIAAAPELLASLTAMIQACEGNFEGVAELECLRDARLLIDRATGVTV